jgi:hypothetical protein
MRIVIVICLCLLLISCGERKRQAEETDSIDKKATVKQEGDVKHVDIAKPANLPMPKVEVKTKELAEPVKKAVDNYATHVDAIWALIDENSDSKEKALEAYQKYYDAHKKELDEAGKVLLPLKTTEDELAVRTYFIKKTQKSQNVVIKLLRNPNTRNRFKETVDYTSKLKLDFIKLN